MATLTYNSEEPQQGEFNADEQESLAVGEQLEEQNQQLLAGKYKDAEDLEKAYLELQSKLGNTQNEEPQPDQQQEQDETPVSFLDDLYNQALDGKVSDETIQQLQKQSPEDLAQTYLEYRKSVEDAGPVPMSDEQVTELKGVVGGDEQYDQLMQWAGQNLDEQQINLYDQVMEKGDPASCYFAVQALRMQYQDSTGIDPDVITGTAPRNVFQGFRSQAELVRAIEDPRYDSDPAYRNDVMTMLENSPGLEF